MERRRTSDEFSDTLPDGGYSHRVGVGSGAPNFGDDGFRSDEGVLGKNRTRGGVVDQRGILGQGGDLQASSSARLWARSAKRGRGRVRREVARQRIIRLRERDGTGAEGLD